jgi:O-antigen ligase
LIAYIYYFIFGIFHNGLVPFHPILADEDAFGPYMVMGVVALYFSAFTCGKIFKKNIAGSLLCVAGVVLSFARGAVIGLTAGLIFIIFKSKKKIITLITVVIMILVASSASLYFFENSQYFEELKTITKASAETESDRIFYWTKAFLIFKDNPIFGAGPRNYGFILPEYVTRDESLERGFYTGFWYGRVPHSLYLQLISEQGIFGALSMIVLLMVFWKRTSSTPRKQTNMPSLEYKSLYHYSLAIKGIMLVFLTTGLFYDFLYSHWLFEFYFLGTAIHNISVFEHELISHEQEFH